MRCGLWLSRRAEVVNRRLRKLDFSLNRAFGGAAQRVFGAEGYPPLVTLLVYPVILFLVYGPTLRWRGWAPVLLVVVSWAALFAVTRLLFRNERRHLVWLQAAAVFVVAATTALLARGREREVEPHVYQHVLLPAIPAMMLVLAVVPPLFAEWLVRGYRRRHPNLRRLLGRAELFVNPARTTFTWPQLVRSLIATPIYRLLQLVFPAACLALLVPHGWMWPAVWSVIAVSAVVIGVAGVHERLSAMLDLTQRTFFVGAQLVLSLAVVALALGRLFEFSYVATLLNSASLLSVLSFLAACYSAAWLFEAWINYALCERLLALLTRTPHLPARRVEFSVGGIPEDQLTRVEPASRSVQIHGARFAAVGRAPNHLTGLPGEAWEVYEKTQLFEELVRRAIVAKPQRDRDRHYGLNDLRKRIQCYFVCLNALLFACVGAGAWLLSRAEQIPVVIAAEAPPSRAGMLRERLFGGIGLTAPPERRRVLLVSSSGGGTRAALYAASVFRGLADLGVLDEVAVASGVSGGSLANAYFAAHRDELLDPSDVAAWDGFRDAMAAPYIDEVIRSCAELRIAGPTRLSKVLGEGFARRIAPADGAHVAATLGEAPIGLIFNTTLAGSSSRSAKGWGAPTRAGVGGRLIFTNVGGLPAFPRDGYPGVPDQYLLYTLVSDPEVHLSDAAALSANFPPVFSNALVECGDRRSWVTDGGASENRGAISLLYALKDSLEQGASDGKMLSGAVEIHVIIVEASATSLTYAEDRGIGSMFGAAEKYASQLMVELLRDIEERFRGLGGADGGFHVHFLPMPGVLRGSGGLGTHWMLPAFVDLGPPEDVTEGGADSAVLDRETVTDLVLDLHREPDLRKTTASEDEAVKRVWSWVERDPHQERWGDLARSLDE